MFREGYESGAVDFKPLVTKMKAANPDLVYAVSYVMDAALLIRQCKELNFNPKMFAGGGGGFSIPEITHNAGDAVNYVFCATLWSESLPFPGAKEFYDKYAKTYNDVPQFQGAQAYVALFVIVDALKRAKDLTPASIREALTKTDMKATMYGPVRFDPMARRPSKTRCPHITANGRNNVLRWSGPRNSQRSLLYILYHHGRRDSHAKLDFRAVPSYVSTMTSLVPVVLGSRFSSLP